MNSIAPVGILSAPGMPSRSPISFGIPRPAKPRRIEVTVTRSPTNAPSTGIPLRSWSPGRNSAAIVSSMCWK